MEHANHVRDYIEGGGIRTYYEAVGEGDPVVLLHGGLCTIETWAPQLAALAEKYRVFMPERRGHGRTADVPGPITYDNMAGDTIAFVSALGLKSAHFVGWSDGAFIGLLVAMQRPDLVGKLCYVSQPINHDGLSPKFRPMVEHLSPEAFPAFLEAAYAKVSPDGPEHYAVILEKVVALYRKEPNMDVDRLRGVNTPTLILLGDDDMHSIPHAAQMQQALPNAQVAVVPGTSHALLMEKPAVANRLILDFLAPVQVEKRF